MKVQGRYEQSRKANFAEMQIDNEIIHQSVLEFMVKYELQGGEGRGKGGRRHA